MSDVFTNWQNAGYSSSAFPAPIQAFLATQNPALCAATTHFDLNLNAVKALVNAVNTALGGP